jgi:hypothetical protein
MIEIERPSQVMPKLPECDRCQFYARSTYTVCAVHAFGVEGDSCLDFREDSNAEPVELWEPEGATYYNGELIVPPQRQLTREEQWHILETHPFFTGVCPKCKYRFQGHVPELIHFDCPVCGWIDDSV